MKYAKSIVIIMFINIIIAFVLIFIGHETRNLELVNLKLKNQIKIIEQEININQIEFALHNDNNYLLKLYQIYNSDFKNTNTTSIFKLSQLSNIDQREILKVSY